MPLVRGYSRAAIAHNVEKEIAAGVDPKQAYAIAQAVARRAKLRARKRKRRATRRDEGFGDLSQLEAEKPVKRKLSGGLLQPEDRAKMARLEQLRRRRKGPFKQPKSAPRVSPPIGETVDWVREMRRYVAAIKAVFDAKIFPLIERVAHFAPLRSIPRGDALDRLDGGIEDEIDRTMRQVRLAIEERYPIARIGNHADRLARSVDDSNARKFQAQARAVIGIEIPLRETGIHQQLALFRRENVSLITRMREEQLGKVEAILLRGARTGARVETLRNEIERRLEVTQSRAFLIARDQVLKLNSELTQLRQEQAGVTQYEWSTSKDERVREIHAELDGTIHRWDDPPVVAANGDRAHPGIYFQCRCVAIPVFAGFGR